MSVINILDPHVADLIAAGEVVERPASVIKELLENAFDAGAQNVTVELRGGGATYIRVTDDGCGMAPEDAGVAFLRHATSKLRDERGLEAIGTMGFRGEALAAISAVSHIELRTRRRGDTEGTRVTLTAGEIDEMGAVGCPEGTTMIVRDLFYNTPARLKFLKSDRSEASACVQTALRCALGRPEVSVRLIRDGSEEFFSPGDGRQDSCVYALLGRDLASSLLPCRGEDEGLRVSGFVSSPSAGRGNRGAQYFFCNGRFIKSQLLQAALEQAYKNSLLTGRYPACALYLELSFGSVDVNVHPAKTEVKFSQERKVFDLVYHAALSALQGEDRLAEPPAAPASAPAPAPAPQKPAPARPDFFRSMSAAQYRAAQPAESPPAESFFSGNLSLHAPEMPEQTRLDLSPAPVSTRFDEKTQAATGFAPAPGPQIVENSVQNVEKSPVPDHKILGEALKTYILVEVGETLLLIDKHAAHERMNFDRLKAMDREILSQTLLAPVTLRPDAGDCELLEQNGELFHELGFEIEPFGRGAYILRAVPADILPGDAVPAIEEMLEKLRRGKAPDAQSVKDELLHTVACKAAIKAGWDTSRAELERIVQEVLSGRVKYCPHGRPVSAVLSKKDLEKMFKRIV
jgi:DNA mismatch repair protein MutL